MPYDSYGRSIEEIMEREAQTRQGMSAEEAAARERAIMNQLQQGNTDLAWDMSGGPYRGNAGVGDTLSSQEAWSRTPNGPQTQAEATPPGWTTMLGTNVPAGQPSSSGPIVGPSTQPSPLLPGPQAPMGPNMGPGMVQGPQTRPEPPGWGNVPSMAGGSPQQQPARGQGNPWLQGQIGRGVAAIGNAITNPRMPDGSMPQGNQIMLDAMGSIGNSLVNPQMADGSMPQGNQMMLDAMGMGEAPQRGSRNPGMGWTQGNPSAINEPSYPYSPNYDRSNMRPSSLQYGLGQQGAPPAPTDNWNRLLNLFGSILEAYQKSEY